MTRDDLLAWLLLPWNIVKAIALTAYWIVAALIRGGDDEDWAATDVPTPNGGPAGREGVTDATATGGPTATAEQRTPT